MGAAIPYIFMLAGGAYSIWGQGEQAKNSEWMGYMSRLNGEIQREMYKSQARMYEFEMGMAERDAASMLLAGEINATMAEREAVNVKQKALEMADKIRENGSALMGTQVSKYAKAGVEISGTPMDTIKNTANDLEKDIAAILASGRDEEFKALSTAAIYRLEGRRGQMQSMSGAARAQSAAGMSRAYGEQAYLGGLFGERGYGYQADAFRGKQFQTILNMGSNMYSMSGLGTKTWGRR